jgi:CHASE2 domain-containing sensor protein
MSNRLGLFRTVALLLIVLASIPLAFFARRAWAFGGREVQFCDYWFRTQARRAPRADMVIVARDQKTLDTMGRPTHTDYGTLIRKLKAAGARWIVLDLDMDDRQGKAADRALWTAIEESHRTLVLVRYAQDRAVAPNQDVLRGLRSLEKSAHWQKFAFASATPQWGWLNFAPATSDFIHSAHGAGVAVTEQSLDGDQAMRRSRAGYLTRVLYPVDTKQGKLTNYYAVVPSLPVITAVSAMGGDKYSLDYQFGRRLSLGGAVTQPMDSHGFVTVNYIGPEFSYPRLSMVDVLRAEPKPDLFRDRIVFIGSTIPTDDLTEYRMTPFGTRMPRVEITANQVQSFLDNRPLFESHYVGLLAVLSLGLMLGIVVPLFRTGPSVVAALAVFGLYLLAGWLLFSMRSIMLPLLPAFILTPVAMAVSVVLGLALRPYAEEAYVRVRDTGMALGPDEPLPEAPRRRVFFRRSPRL